MATLTDLENAIDALLNHPLGAGWYQLVRQVEEKAYDAYVFGLCLERYENLVRAQFYGASADHRYHSSFVARPVKFTPVRETLDTRNSHLTDMISKYTLGLSLREQAE